MSRSVPSPCAIGAEQLVALAEVLGEAVELTPGDAARLVRLRDASADDLDGDELEIGVRPLERGEHPLEVLVGFRAPADWAAIGVVATGRAWHVDEPRASAFAVRTVHLVARSGAWASSWIALDDDRGEPATTESGTTTRPTGRIDDALRRAIHLPTAPPGCGTLRLWTTQWLDALLAGAAERPSSRRRRRSLEALVAAHPAVDALDLDPAVVDLGRLVAAGRRLAAWRDWSQLRRACAGRLWNTPAVDADTAAWLDDGAFARWVLGWWPELADLRDALGVLLAPSAISVIDDALAGWGLADVAASRH